MYATHGVTSVFKRFFKNHCELQIFFSKGFDIAQSDASVVEAVVDALVENDSNKKIIEIRNMKRFRILPRRLAKISGTVGGKDFVVVGDAALSAHYRLGIGVNLGIMISESKLSLLLKNEASLADWSDMTLRLYADAQVVMHSYIMFESKCNLVLFEKSVFLRDYFNKDYIETKWESVREICIAE